MPDQQAHRRLDAAAFSGPGVRDAAGQTLACRALTSPAERLAAGH